jgi:hypothetical protein
MRMACHHNAECKPVDGGTPEPGPQRREHDSRVGRAICARHRGNRKVEWEEKATKRVARSVSQQDVVDVRSCSVKRWSGDFLSAGILDPVLVVRLCGLHRTTSLFAQTVSQTTCTKSSL